jgi:hypothetical protein|tara:strand:- start:2132 stop:2350 length:219 start_codon:yes stop_codon:yes gene_type:complete
MIEIQNLTTKVLMASRPHCPDVSLLAFLSELGRLDDNGREQVLETARVAYDDYNQRTQMLYQGPFDQACYND